MSLLTNIIDLLRGYLSNFFSLSILTKQFKRLEICGEVDSDVVQCSEGCGEDSGEYTDVLIDDSGENLTYHLCGSDHFGGI